MPISVAPPVGAGSTIVSIWAEEGRAASTYEGTVFPVGEHDHPTEEVVGLTADLATRATLTGAETLTNKTLDGPLVRPVGSGLVGLTIQGLAAQTGNLIELRDNVNALLARLAANGDVYGSGNKLLITQEAANAAYVVRADAATATVNTTESTTSTTFVDLATVGPAATVTVGASGKALLVLTAEITHDTAGGISLMAFAVSGATTIAADANMQRLRIDSSTVGAQYSASAVYMLTGLTPGVTTFTSKYRTVAGAATFLRRNLVVIPF